MQQLVMHRPNLDGLPAMPPTPDGLRMIVAGLEDAERLAGLLAAAFGDSTWDAGRAREVLLEAADVAATYVLVAETDFVATASVLLREDRGDDAGYLHWVAVHPDWQGRRLGYHVSLRVLLDMAGYAKRHVYLKTDDHRLPAIKTYANLGFDALIHTSKDIARWKQVQERIPELRMEFDDPDVLAAES